MLSLVICTYNRCDSLKETLESLIGQKVGDGFDFEILVVDNGSSDQTKEVVQALQGRFEGRLKYLVEQKKGKPSAMNNGIAQALGDIIAFTDDDCIIEDKDFLYRIERAFKEQGPEVGFIGGRIVPDWMGKPVPSWMTESFLSALAMLDYGDEPFVLTYDRPDRNKRLFYGANIAFRREMFVKYGQINVAKILAQDTEICLRLLKAGVKGYYAPEIKVRHKVFAERLTKEYFYSWYYKRGFYQDQEHKIERKFYHPCGVPIWLIFQTVQYYVQSLVACTPAQRLSNRCMMHYNRGWMAKITGNKEIKSK